MKTIAIDYEVLEKKTIEYSVPDNFDVSEDSIRKSVQAENKGTVIRVFVRHVDNKKEGK